jgi:hypothetical protein
MKEHKNRIFKNVHEFKIFTSELALQPREMESYKCPHLGLHICVYDN